MRILITAGGTGGHLFPALSLAQELARREKDAQILFVISKGALAKEITASFDIDTFSISAAPFPSGLSLSRYFLFAINSARAIIESMGILRSFRPDAAVGFGGYSSFALIFCASLSAVPALIHEQNVIMGKANRALSFLARRIALSFPQNETSHNRKFVLTGNPIREDLLGGSKEEALKFFGLKEGIFTLLIMGGSQGSHAINEAASGLPGLFGEDEKDNIQIIHLAGSAENERLARVYSESGMDARVIPFLKDMRYAYKAADLVVARSGATTLAELCALGIASILVPYPYASGHQMANAKLLEEFGGCRIIEQEALSPILLYGEVKRLLRDRAGLERMRICARQLGRPRAASDLAEEVVKLTKV